jgi:hypothetical protein
MKSFETLTLAKQEEATGRFDIIACPFMCLS